MIYQTMKKNKIIIIAILWAAFTLQNVYAQTDINVNDNIALSSVQNNVSNISNLQKPKFNSYIYAGLVADYYYNECSSMRDWYGPKLDISLGCRINKYIYIGGNIGQTVPILGWSWKLAHSGLDFLARNHYTHLSGNLKVFIPTKNEKITPFIDVNIGGNYEYRYESGGLYISCGAGVDISRFSIILGYEGLGGLVAKEFDNNLLDNLIHIKLGVRLGK